MSVVLNESDFLKDNLNNLLDKLEELTDYQLEVLDSVLYAVKVDREYRGHYDHRGTPKYIMTATMRKLQ